MPRVQSQKKYEKGSSLRKSIRLGSRVEKEYLKPSYTASVGDEFEDGLFDGAPRLHDMLMIIRLQNPIIHMKIMVSNADFLELALQFGMITMFACAFPLVFCFAALVSHACSISNASTL